MANDEGLVDEYEKIQKLKEELELKEKEIREKIIELAKKKNTEILFGSHSKCSIKEYEKIVYPEDKTQIINLMKQKGIYESYSTLNYMRLNSAITKGNVTEEIVKLVKKEKAFRLSLKDLA